VLISILLQSWHPLQHKTKAVMALKTKIHIARERGIYGHFKSIFKMNKLDIKALQKPLHLAGC